MKKLVCATLAGLYLVSGLTGCSGSSSSSEATMGYSTATAPEAAIASSSPEVQAAPEPEAAAFAVGETSTLGDWGITVSGFEVKDRIDSDYGTYFSPENGNRFGVVSLTVTNNGKSSASFLPSFSLSDDVSAKIYFGDGYEYSATSLLGHDQDMHDATLNPLTSKEGIIAFDLPNAVTNSEDLLVFTLSAGSESVTYALR